MAEDLPSWNSAQGPFHNDPRTPKRSLTILPLPQLHAVSRARAWFTTTLLQPPENAESGHNGHTPERLNIDDISYAYNGHTELGRMLRERDHEQIKAWSKQIDALFIWAGLFCGILITIIVEVYKLLDSDSSPSAASDSKDVQGSADGAAAQRQRAVMVNMSFFVSLMLSIFAVGLGLLIKEWLREYTLHLPTQPRALARTLQYRWWGLSTWHIGHLVGAISILLQIAVGFFQIGMLAFVWPLDPLIRAAVASVIALHAFVWLTTALAPAFSASCPYKSPLAHLFFRLATYARLAGHHLCGTTKPAMSLGDREDRITHKYGRALDEEALLYVNEEHSGDPHIWEVNRPCLDAFPPRDAALCALTLTARRLGCSANPAEFLQAVKQITAAKLREDDTVLMMGLCVRYSSKAVTCAEEQLCLEEEEQWKGIAEQLARVIRERPRPLPVGMPRTDS